MSWHGVEEFKLGLPKEQQGYSFLLKAVSCFALNSTLVGCTAWFMHATWVTLKDWVETQAELRQNEQHNSYTKEANSCELSLLRGECLRCKCEARGEVCLAPHTCSQVSQAARKWQARAQSSTAPAPRVSQSGAVPNEEDRSIMALLEEVYSRPKAEELRRTVP